jgi:glucosamine-6-phosphate deaminase
MDVICFHVEGLKVEVHADKYSLGRASAAAAAEAILDLDRSWDPIPVIFATGASQLEMLAALTGRQDIPWNKIAGFHLDEYIGIDANHPASFRRYLRENLTARVAMREFHEIDGNASDPEGYCTQYAERLREANPQLCLLGIGENGHLAFNDPGEADFHDPRAMKAVQLDAACRAQQAAEGWFRTRDEVPTRALTLTIPTILRVPRLILSIPGKRKAAIVKRALFGPISTECPATILRTHAITNLFLDAESAAELDLATLTQRFR